MVRLANAPATRRYKTGPMRRPGMVRGTSTVPRRISHSQPRSARRRISVVKGPGRRIGTHRAPPRHIIVQSHQGPVAVPVQSAPAVVYPSISSAPATSQQLDKAPHQQAANAVQNLDAAIDALHSIPMADEWLNEHANQINNLEQVAGYAQNIYDMFRKS